MNNVAYKSPQKAREVRQMNCKCGFVNESGSRFCNNCGSVLAAAPVLQISLKRGLIVGIAILALSVFMVLMSKLGDRATRQIEADRSKESLTAPTPPTVQTKQEPAQLTAADRLAYAKSTKIASASREQLEVTKKYLIEIRPSEREYRDAKTILAQINSRLSHLDAEEVVSVRDRLKSNYRELMATANPHLNFIESQLTKGKGGYQIWAVHTYFSQYSFSIGEDAKITSRWIVSNHENLVRAQIKTVGVKGEGPFRGSCWLTVD